MQPTPANRQTRAAIRLLLASALVLAALAIGTGTAFSSDRTTNGASGAVLTSDASPDAGGSAAPDATVDPAGISEIMPPESTAPESESAALRSEAGPGPVVLVILVTIGLGVALAYVGLRRRSSSEA